MSLCSLCGIEVGGSASLCAHHGVSEQGWATQNRIMCDLLHRGIGPPRLPAVEHLDDFVVTARAG